MLIREARPILAVLVGPSQESLEKQSRLMWPQVKECWQPPEVPFFQGREWVFF